MGWLRGRCGTPSPPSNLSSPAVSLLGLVLLTQTVAVLSITEVLTFLSLSTTTLKVPASLRPWSKLKTKSASCRSPYPLRDLSPHVFCSPYIAFTMGGVSQLNPVSRATPSKRVIQRTWILSPRSTASENSRPMAWLSGSAMALWETQKSGMSCTLFTKLFFLTIKRAQASEHRCWSCCMAGYRQD